MELPDNMADRHNLAGDVGVCLFLCRMGTLSYIISYLTRAPTNYEITISTNNSCQMHRKVCKSVGAVKEKKTIKNGRKKNTRVSHLPKLCPTF